MTQTNPAPLGTSSESSPSFCSKLTVLYYKGTVVYVITSIIAMTAQSLILRQPAIRQKLRIPLIPAHLRQPSPSMRDSFEFARKWWVNKVSEARESQRPINGKR